MSKVARVKSNNTAQKKPAAPAPRLLKPRPKLMIGLGIAFALWVATLLYLYFTTVYPHRSHP